MGVVDDFKSEKNKNMIILATEKMLKDKYDIIIEKDELIVIINSIVFTICSDVVLIKSVVKIMELNTIALTKVKEFIDNKNNSKDNPEISQDIKKDIPTDEDVAKYNSEELLTKVLQLEEKRNAINALAKTQMNQPDLNKGQGQQSPTVAEMINKPDAQNLSQLSQLSPMSPINMYSIIEKLDDVINRKKNINYKSLIINSYNRDWIKYPQRNKLSLSVNIDFTKNLIEPDKLLLPNNIKSRTPYIIMIISDGKQSQKFQFISRDSGDSSGSSWDTWVLLNSDREYSRNIILLNNKNWHISFTDYLNKDLDMGRDCIKTSRITKIKHCYDNDDNDDNDDNNYGKDDEGDDDNEDEEGNERDDNDKEYNYYNIVINTKNIHCFNDLNLVNKYDTLLLGSDDGINIPIKVLDIDSNIIKFRAEKNYEINTKNNNYYLLNYKAQYTIMLSYYSKI
jgi:hypothetical protein